MKTIVVNIPDKKESFLLAFFKKHRLKARVVEAEEDETLMAKWIDEGMKSGEVTEEAVFETLRKNGVEI